MICAQDFFRVFRICGNHAIRAKLLCDFQALLGSGYHCDPAHAHGFSDSKNTKADGAGSEDRECIAEPGISLFHGSESHAEWFIQSGFFKGKRIRL